jgi:RNA polymerase sigma-70 factor, ECF subfamily
MYSSARDAELIDRVRGGQPDSFGELVQPYEKAMRAVLRGYRFCPEDVADLMQQTLLQAYRKLHQFRGEASFKSWLCRIAENTARQTHRSQRNQPTRNAESENVIDWRLCSRASDSSTLEKVEAAYWIRKVRALPRPDGPALFLMAVYGYNHEEIARLERTTVSAVKSRLYRARRMLREQA